MPRPELYPVKKVIGFDRAMLEAIDSWRRIQSPIPTVSDAIRQLVMLGLIDKLDKRPKKTGNRVQARKPD